VVPLTDYENSLAYKSMDGGRSFPSRAPLGAGCSDPSHTLALAQTWFYACQADDSTVRVFESTDSASSWRERWRSPEHRSAGTPTLLPWNESAIVVWQEASAGCRSLWAKPFRVNYGAAESFRVSGPDCRWHIKRDYLTKRYPWGGDYIGVAASPFGQMVVWPRADSRGRRRLEVVVFR
jgi:hypothetical protein